MARLFVPPERLGGERVVLQDEENKYLVRVLRLEAGDAVVLFDGHGQEIEARLESVSARGSVLRLGARRSVVLPAVRVTLVQAVPRGDRMDLVVQKATELGIARIVPVLSARTGAQPLGESRLRRWRTIATEAARQCGRADVPSIDDVRPLADALAEAPEEGQARLFVWEASRGSPLRRALTGTEAAVRLLVGPEGGFAESEARDIEAAGYRAVGLGSRILRSETAALVAVALVQAAVGALD